MLYTKTKSPRKGMFPQIRNVERPPIGNLSFDTSHTQYNMHSRDILKRNQPENHLRIHHHNSPNHRLLQMYNPRPPKDMNDYFSLSTFKSVRRISAEEVRQRWRNKQIAIKQRLIRPARSSTWSNWLVPSLSAWI